MTDNLPSDESGAGERRLILAIESSCDETAASVIDSDLNILANVVASQTDLHQRFGGVVPEIASRAHVENILPVIDESLRQANATLQDLSAIAAVTHPGLVGSLLIGLTAAKTLAAVFDLPLVAVDHLQAHIFACRLAAGRDVFPAVGLVVSGGHTNLYDCQAPLEMELLGSTIDDAAGEAFDKVAAMLGLDYPGGPSIERAARDGNPAAYDFPRSFIKQDRLEFSFSGLKTAVLYRAAGQQAKTVDPASLSRQQIADIAASFQEAVVDVLAAKCGQALQQLGYRTLCVGGGVAANGRLREKLTEVTSQCGAELIIPPMELCTDNAAMAAIAWELLARGETVSLDVGVQPRLVRKK
ncbi:tRNA N6-adenosine threonylcarbamoyltransferase [Symmachiella dynata]|uniref:tRNA (adenosine(37)-N6)-threonylcarbamoyltransferase complex transferase subunit TsaD n=1 Tax=Symmachiella dynata TaxID=2527995 RepID=UPI00118CB850|nr:tRNA (adenosine(37)-N6)-threonylcarbamoyltransferase complex transferase subunit TsaD [Symmachiella dynata]QDT49779.1 tRNA N6-adenosine threonylcarbamoyltransferase [Symmachiella dynata]